MSDWDKFEQQAKHKPMTETIEALLDARRKKDDAEKLVEQLEAKLIAEFPEEFGEQSKQIGDNIITVNRQERYNWNQEKLEEIFKSYDIYQKKVLKYPFNSEKMCEDYLSLFNKLINKKQEIFSSRNIRNLQVTNKYLYGLKKKFN